MTDVVDSSPEGGVSVIVSYTMDLAGETVSLPGMSVKYGVKKGPVVVMGNVQAPDKIRQLTEVEAARVSGNTVTAGNRTYLMSDNVLVYEYRGGDYYLSSLDRVKDRRLRAVLPGMTAPRRTAAVSESSWQNKLP